MCTPEYHSVTGIYAGLRGARDSAPARVERGGSIDRGGREVTIFPAIHE